MLGERLPCCPDGTSRRRQRMQIGYDISSTYNINGVVAKAENAAVPLVNTEYNYYKDGKLEYDLLCFLLNPCKCFKKISRCL